MCEDASDWVPGGCWEDVPVPDSGAPQPNTGRSGESAPQPYRVSSPIKRASASLADST
jgi:hypothetical protein